MPDWSADWLHKDAVWILDYWSRAEHGKPYDELTGEAQAGLKSRLKDEMRTNTSNPETGDLMVSPMRAEAIRVIGQHYTALSSDDPELDKLRDAYAIPVNAISGPALSAQINNFCFLIGFEVYENLTLSQARPWVRAYKWLILSFVAVAFWNLVGAGLFGFLINPSITLSDIQGLNTTVVHGHAALFGVYGMLGIGLMLFGLKGLTTHQRLEDRGPEFRLLVNQQSAWP